VNGIILDGKKAAAAIRKEVREQVEKYKEQGIQPKLCAVLVGDDPASVLYARAKARACEKSGIEFQLVELPASTTGEEVTKIVRKLSDDQSCHGIMIELPLPGHIDPSPVLIGINPLKDVDGLSPVSKGAMFKKKDGLFPVTPQSCIEILKRNGISLEGKHVCLVGRGETVGKPLILLLLNENATVTVCHTKTRDLKTHTKQADIVVAAAGRAGLITADMISPGSVVVDAGINEVDGETVGDVDFEAVSQMAYAITPVPGGVGSLTTALIQKNLLKAIELQL
jgi:methylenetetrahydrofolate dehydrogenase (NADP+)/methenyltetrahydrofolate cyclohydrolase